MKKTKQTKSNDQTKLLENKIVELDTKWKRALADYQNLEKRTQAERGNFIRLANATLISKVLGIIDDLERAADHLKDDGVSMIVKQLDEILKEEGVEEILAQGQVFDPNKMECVEISSGEKDMVSRVTQRGYTIHDTVIRPAKVEVGGGTSDK